MSDKFQEGIKLIRENAELREENRLVSEQNEKLNDVLLANEKELSERLSSEEMVDIQSENYSSWLKEKEGRLLAESRIAELEAQALDFHNTASEAFQRAKKAESRIAELEGEVEEEAERADGHWRRCEKLEAIVKILDADNDGVCTGVEKLIERAEKAEAELKEQTRLGLACHDELAELKAKIRKMVAKW